MTLSDLCCVSNMSALPIKQFHRLCRFPPTISSHPRENACKMLEHSDHSIAQIAGLRLYDSSHFPRCSARSKMLPKDYRSSVKRDSCRAKARQGFSLLS
ncbi:MAG: hypothetical protein ACLRSW_05520 [Christensenellaceae bacterium]